jgi:glycosyltransferase involved in cell wall biosynthesis
MRGPGHPVGHRTGGHFRTDSHRITPMRELLSAVIITRDAGTQLEACLRGLDFVDEVLVVDSGSRDNTVELARACGARVLHQDWLGYGPQKQFAAEQARHDWILSLDADERLSDTLRADISRELDGPRVYAYVMPRCNRFMGRWLRHGEGYPDLSLRLFHRGHARWSDDSIHEKVIADGPVGRLQGDLLHESHTTIADYLSKQNRYTTLQAEQLHACGKRAGVAKMLLSPLFRFVKFYFFRLGFLDGIPGLVHILIGCFNTFSKYAKLRELRQR